MSGFEWGRDKAVELMNAALLEQDGPKQADILSQLRELLINKHPELLSEFAPKLLELQMYPSGATRKNLAAVLEEMGARGESMPVVEELVPDFLRCLTRFLQDPTAAVVKRALTSGSTLFRRTFSRAAKKGGGPAVVKSLRAAWEVAKEFKAAAVQLARESTNDGVRLHAVRFVEAVVLMYTATHSNGPNPTDVVVPQLPSTHLLLDAPTLMAEAKDLLHVLTAQLELPHGMELAGPVVIVLINSTATIGRQRAEFMDLVLPVLLRLAQAAGAPQAESATQASVSRALKDAFVRMIKQGGKAAEAWRDQMSQELCTLGAREAAEQAIRQADRAAHREAKEKRTREHEEARLAHEQSKRARHEADTTNTNSRASTSIPAQSGGVGGVSKSVPAAPAPPPSASAAPATNIPSSAVGKGAVGSNEKQKHLDQVMMVLNEFLVHDQKELLNKFINSLQPELLADLVIANLKFLPESFEQAVKNQPTLALESASIPVTAPAPAGEWSASQGPTDPRQARAAAASLRPSPGDPPPPASTSKSAVAAQSSASSMKNVKQELPVGNTGVAPRNSPPPQPAHPETKPTLNDVKPNITRAAKPGVPGAVKSEPAPAGAQGLNPMDVDVPTPGSRPVQALQTAVALPAPVLGTSELAVMHQKALQRIISTGGGAKSTLAPFGGRGLRLSLLVRMLEKAPMSGDTYADELLEHLLTDYHASDGHALAMHWLFQLFVKEAAGEGSELAAHSGRLSAGTQGGAGRVVREGGVYERTLMAIAEGLLRKLPYKDRALAKLLAEVPHLPPRALALLESLCCARVDSLPPSQAGSSGADASTLGLATMWDLIVQCPRVRQRCLRVVLDCGVAREEGLRGKAIRLLANKLFPMAVVGQQIEDFARDCLKRATKREVTEEDEVDDKSSAAERGRFVPLFFALCTKKHDLLEELLAAYSVTAEEPALREVFQAHVTGLIRTIGGESPQLVALVRNLPEKCVDFVLATLSVLVEGGKLLSPNMVEAVQELHKREGDARLLVPVVPTLSKAEVVKVLPTLVCKLPSAELKQSLASMYRPDALSPVELMVALHALDPARDQVPLKKVMEACTMCFQHRAVFTPEVLAVVLNQLVEQAPLPLLLMRTVIQTIAVAPKLKPRVIETLSKLVNKRVWQFPRLWEGFIKCAQQIAPDSYQVLLQLPVAQLEDALRRSPALLQPLAKYASIPHVQATVSRATLMALGLISEDPSVAAPADVDIPAEEDSCGVLPDKLRMCEERTSSCVTEAEGGERVIERQASKTPEDPGVVGGLEVEGGHTTQSQSHIRTDTPMNAVHDS